MKKRTIAMIVSLVLALALGLGGTLAYLTDTDADVNTMVLGNVQIVQNEQERVKNADGTYTGVLQEFTNNQTIYPAVYGLSTDPDRAEVKVGDYTITINGGMHTFPNYVDKIVTVTNIGKSDAYVRTLIAIPSKNTVTQDDVSEQWLHYNPITDTDTDKRNGWYAGQTLADGEWGTNNNYLYQVNIKGKVYEVYTATNVNKIAPGETTGPCLAGFYLSKEVDYEDGYYKDAKGEKVWEADELDIIVLTQAVQAQGFSDAYTALNESFGEVKEENKTKVAAWFEAAYNDIGSPDGDKNDTNNPPSKPVPTTEWSDRADTSWFDASKKEFSISTPEQLAGIAKLGAQLGGKTVTLTDDIDLDGHLWTPINVFNPENSFTFDGDNHTISNMIVADGANKGLFDNTVGTIKNVKIVNANMVNAGRSGIIAGRHYGDIINCHVENSTIEDYYWAVGGIVGMLNSGDIKDCSLTNVTVKGNGAVGGIVGLLNETSGTRNIINCKVNGCVIETTDMWDGYTTGGIVAMYNIENATVNITGCTVSNTKFVGEQVYEIAPPSETDVTVNIN